MGLSSSWSIDAARQHYRIQQWSNGQFDVNDLGHVVANISGQELDLHKLSQKLRESSIKLPTLVRFPQILQQSLDNLYTAFAKAIKTSCYSNSYLSAYPVKVNQQACILRHFHNQSDWPVAFEVGSKAELLACMSQAPEKMIICNGYKDESYVRLALIGQLLGYEIVVVLESLQEFEYVLNQADQLSVQPRLGLRVRLSSIAKGNWQNSGGEYAKFGLTAREVIQLLNLLTKHKVSDWVCMLHFHMGSQIPSLQGIHLGVQEAMQFFVQISQANINLNYLNIGGGLAVDYEGSSAGSYFSMDYSVEEYAEVVINTVNQICIKHHIQSPIIVSENGRAMVAHHAVLLTNVIDIESPFKNFYTCDDVNQHDGNKNISSLIDLNEKLKNHSANLCSSEKIYDLFNQVKFLANNIQNEFMHGEVSLKEIAHTEELVNTSYGKLLSIADEANIEIEALFDKTTYKYFCNFSLFQSIPDVWGLDQIFPIVPLHRLHKYPSNKARICDLTCDSDGQIESYIENNSIKPYLSLHDINGDQGYILGIFLVGAYQEILGDMHNLFGDTNAVNVVLNPDGSYQILEEEPGDNIKETLSYVHIEMTNMRQIWSDQLAELPGLKKEELLQELESILQSTNYLN